jgi:hypothetical protein
MQKSSNAPRVLAVLALLAAVIALMVVISDSLSDGGSSSRNNVPAGLVPTKKGHAKKGKRFYVFQPGDTGLGSVARKTGVSVNELERLNSDIDTFSLQVGERIRIR